MNSISFFHFQNLIQKLLLIVLLCLCLISGSIIPFHYSQAKTKKIQFQKKITSITVGKTFRYRIKNLPKKAKVTYSCNHKKIAFIHKKKGIFIAKKKGKATIKAKIILSGNKKKILKTNVRILEQKKTSASSASEKAYDATAETLNLPLTNTTLTVDNSIHPWNHSLILYSSRILLESEVKNSNLTLVKNSDEGDTPLTIHANFEALSDDGKEITYSVDTDDTIKLCPGDGTSNGRFAITSSLFSGKLFIDYRERLTPNEVRGFAFDTLQNPLSDISVSLYQKKENLSPILIKTVKTDKRGYYSFHDLPDGSYYVIAAEITDQENSSSLESSFSNSDVFSTENSYISSTTEVFSLNDSIHCENFTLKKNEPVLMCKITDENDEPLSGIPILISKKDSSLCWQGYSDKQGLFVLSKEIYSSSENYTRITYKNGLGQPQFWVGTLPAPDDSSQITGSEFNMDDTYDIIIFPEDAAVKSTTQDTILSEASPYESTTFSYSPKDNMTEQAFFQISLNSLPVLHTDSLSIKWDNTNNFTDNTEIISEVEHLNMKLLHTDGCPVFSAVCPVKMTTSDSPRMISSTVNKLLKDEEVRLRDSDYYISIQAYDKSNSPCSIPFISHVTVNKGILSQVDAILYPGVSAKILLFGNFPIDTVQSLPCTLYELLDSTWIPVNSLQSTDFEYVTDSYCKAYVNLTHLKMGHAYRLEGATENISLIGDCKFTIKEDTVSPALSEYTVPSFQFACGSLTTPSKEYNHFHTTNTIAMDKDYFLKTLNIKNCVYAYYLNDGTMCSSVQTNENDVLILHPDTQLIAFYDKLQSGMTLKTSQPSYRSSVFSFGYQAVPSLVT